MPGSTETIDLTVVAPKEEGLFRTFIFISDSDEKLFDCVEFKLNVKDLEKIKKMK